MWLFRRVPLTSVQLPFAVTEVAAGSNRRLHTAMNVGAYSLLLSVISQRQQLGLPLTLWCSAAVTFYEVLLYSINFPFAFHRYKPTR